MSSSGVVCSSLKPISEAILEKYALKNSAASLLSTTVLSPSCNIVWLSLGTLCKKIETAKWCAERFHLVSSNSFQSISQWVFFSVTPHDFADADSLSRFFC